MSTPVVLLIGCGGSLGANSSCRDYMDASRSAQNDAVSKLAGELNAPSAVTPLGRPNIDYLCAGHPEWTLGDVVRRSG